MTCTGAGGSDSDTASVTVYEPPEVDAWFNRSSITLGNSVTLNWSSTDASRCSGSPSIGSTSTSGTKSYTPSSTGSFWVRVTCTGAGGSDSDSARVTVYAPPAPTLTAPPTDPDGSYTVRWTSVSGATSYKLEEKSGSGSFREVYTGSGTSKSFSGKTPAIYTYRVRACVGECSVWLSTDTTKVPPGVPTLTVPATDADGDYAASWTSVVGATAYELEEKPPGGSFDNIYDEDGTSHDVTDNSPGIYMYRARACADAGNCGDWSSTGTTKVPPGVPTLTVPSTDKDGSYSAMWTSPSGATSYELQEKSGSGAWSESELLTTTSNSYTGRTPAIYMHRVRACAGSGNCGGWSLIETTKVPPGTPMLTVPATDADGDYAVRWTSPTGATSYELEEKPAGGSFANAYRGDNDSTNITGKADGTYSYQARACAGKGNCGDWSSAGVGVGGAYVSAAGDAEHGAGGGGRHGRNAIRDGGGDRRSGQRHGRRRRRSDGSGGDPTGQTARRLRTGKAKSSR